MGDSMTSSVRMYGDLLDNWSQTLERQYHHLTRVIRPHLFYGWLRAKGVFTHDDQEEVEKMFITTCLKAGHLIDIIKTKGKAGFVAFLEVVEYEYPELFFDITGKQPRTPPYEFCPNHALKRCGSSRRNRQQDGLRSVDVLQMIGDLTCTLTQALAVKSEQLHKLTSLIDHMKTEHEQEAEDHSSMCRELKDLRETVEELNTEKSMLNHRIRAMKEERDNALQQCNELRSLKDKFMDDCHQLRLNYDKIALERTTSEKYRHNTGASKDAKFAKKEFSSERKEAVVRWPVEELGTLRNKLQQKQQEWDEEKKHLESQMKGMESRYQTSIVQVLGSVTQIKAERDQALQQLCDLEKKYVDEVSKNEKLSSECRQYIEEFKRMEETIENMKYEIDQRNRQTPKLQLRDRSILEHMKIKYPCVQEDNLNSPIEGSFSEVACGGTWHAEKQTSAEATRAPGESGTSTPATPSSSITPSFATSDSNKCNQHPPLGKAKPIPDRTTMEFPPVRAVPSSGHPELKERRKGSFIAICPFVIYAPEDFQQRLHQYLLRKSSNFDDCIYEQVADSQKLPTHEVIHEKTASDGSTILRLTVDSLKRCMSDGKHAILLPALPVTSIDTMRRHDIQPVVIIIKLTDESECCELTAHDELLDRHSNGLCEHVDIDIALTNDFEKFAGQVLNALLHLVQKYTFLVGLHSDSVETKLNVQSM